MIINTCYTHYINSQRKLGNKTFDFSVKKLKYSFLTKMLKGL